MSIDPNSHAREQLAAAMIPTPDDLANDLDPMACLFYLEQLGWTIFTVWTAFAEEQSGQDSQVDDDLAVTLAQLGVIVGMLDQACIRVGLLPVEAAGPGMT